MGIGDWLKRNEHLASWLEVIIIGVALTIGAFQLSDARKALQQSAAATEQSALANEIALRNRISDILIKINELSILNPELSVGYTPKQRVHLLRLEYFIQIFNMNEKGKSFSPDRICAEEAYLAWVVTQQDFQSAWAIAGPQYPSDFRSWVKGVMSHQSRYGC